MAQFLLPQVGVLFNACHAYFRGGILVWIHFVDVIVSNSSDYYFLGLDILDFHLSSVEDDLVSSIVAQLRNAQQIEEQILNIVHVLYFNHPIQLHFHESPDMPFTTSSEGDVATFMLS